MIRIMRNIIGGVSAALVLTVASTASAQGTDPRWQAWLGCWRPDAAPAIVRTADSVGLQAPMSLVCVVPGSTPTSVEVVNFTNGAVASRGIIEPTGARIPKSVEDCNGWETAQWSADNRRVMLRSEFTCANNVSRKESSLLAMSTSGEWLQIQNLAVEGNSAVYFGRLRHSGIAVEGVENGALVERPILDEQGRVIAPSRAGCTGSESANPVGDRIVVRGAYDCGGLRRVSNAVFERNANGQWVRVDKTLPMFSTLTSRLAAGGPVRSDAIVELVKNVDHAVVETWLADREQRFDLDGRALVKLADAGVPPRVIDVLVALDNPGKLLVRPNTQAVAVDANRGARGGNVGGGGFGVAGGYFDPWLNPWDPYGFRWRYGFGLDPYAYSVGYGWGLGGFGGGFGRGGYPYGGGGPIVVIPQGVAREQARAVLGSGYTRGGRGTPERPATGYIPSAGAAASSSSRGSSSAQTGSGTAGSSGGSSGGAPGRS